MVNKTICLTKYTLLIIHIMTGNSIKLNNLLSKKATWSESFPVVFEVRNLPHTENFSERETQLLAQNSVRILCHCLDTQRSTNMSELAQ